MELDTSTDVNNAVHLSVFICNCNTNCTIIEEFLELTYMPGTAGGKDIPRGRQFTTRHKNCHLTILCAL
jgi:hypothetical protein